MNQNYILPDDPRLTAYALDEMAAGERVEFEKLLSADPVARQAVEEIRTAGAMFATALEQEPTFADPAVGRKAAIIPGGDLGKLDGGGEIHARLKRPIRFPQFYYMVSGLAAACFAVFFIYWQENQPVPGASKQYVEVDLDKFAAAESGGAAATPTASGPYPAVMMGNEVAAPVPEAIALPTFTDVGPAATVTDDLSLVARSAPVAAPAHAPVDASSAPAEQVVGLSPFAGTGQELGYHSATTVAGTRMPSDLGDAGHAVGAGGGRNIGLVQAYEALAAKAGGEREGSSGWAARKMSLAAPMMEQAFNTEDYGFRKDNDYVRVTDHPLSTFAVDVDTASYANVRRFLAGGHRPPADAVRIEELVNYFPYGYAQPVGGAPFAASLEAAAAPWAPEHRLVRIGLKGREVSDLTRPAANLVFLLDVSGSMRQAQKLPLVKQSLRLLVKKLRADDRVAMAVYAGSAGLALPSTPASRQAEILEAIERLEAGGSTNGGMGIHLAYDIAKANFIPGGVNRVILATDGDFNVGTTGEGDLGRLVAEKAKDGVFLSVLGFGMGNLKDGALERIADKGNGNYAYIDSLDEAKKALVEQAGGTLVTIAKDVKIQVEFNPAQVAAYRLIGYENRLLAKEDFNNDAVDAGEIGAGHTVTALYEIVPAGVELPVEAPGVDPLKYQKVAAKERGEGAPAPSHRDEMLTVKIRYKEPAGDVSSRLEFVLRDTGARFEDASQDFKFAAAVAGFGMVLRDSPHKGSLTLAEVAAWGRAGTGSDAGGYRGEFLSLVERAQAVMQ